MMISTRGRYALRVMLELAEYSSGEYVPMKEIAHRQGISLKYLEKILPALTKNGLVEGVQGKGGGYKLTRSPEEYPVGEILRLTEGDLAPVSCLECGAELCPKRGECKTLSLWLNLHGMINGYLDSVSLADLINGSVPAP